MLVIGERANQLGNRLFLFAHAIACAAEHGVQLVNLGFAEYAQYFETTSRDLLCRYPARTSLLANERTRLALSNFAASVAKALPAGGQRTFAKSRVHVLRSGYVTTLADPGGSVDLGSDSLAGSLSAGRLTILLGPLFRDFRSLRKHMGPVREYFQPLERFRSNVELLHARAREGADVLVGVHVRQGDYEGFLAGRFLYTTEQYVGLMHGVERLFGGKRVHFVLCSDQPQPAASFSCFTVFSGSGQIIEDLSLLGACDFIVGPPSTFSAWASFYGRVPRYTVMDPDLMPTLPQFVICNG